MISLTKEQIIAMHHDLIQQTGGSSGIRDDGLLDSALAVPYQSFEGKDIYTSIQQKADRLAYGLIKNHAFIDGNKRVGAHVMLVILSLNHIDLEYTQQELSDIILSVAAGESGYDELLLWIVGHQT